MLPGKVTPPHDLDMPPGRTSTPDARLYMPPRGIYVPSRGLDMHPGRTSTPPRGVDMPSRRLDIPLRGLDMPDARLVAPPRAVAAPRRRDCNVSLPGCNAPTGGCGIARSDRNAASAILNASGAIPIASSRHWNARRSTRKRLTLDSQRLLRGIDMPVARLAASAAGHCNVYSTPIRIPSMAAHPCTEISLRAGSWLTCPKRDRASDMARDANAPPA